MAFPPNEDGREISSTSVLVFWTKFGSLVRFTQIPSKNLRIQSSQYDSSLVDGYIVKLTFDPAQDLVIVLETTIVNNLTCPLISARSLLTGEKHPMAAELVCWLGDSNIPLVGSLIGVYGDHVALIIRQPLDRIARVMVFNWKTSNVIQDIYRERKLEGCEWLTERYLLLVETHNIPTPWALTIVDVLNPDYPVICTLNLPKIMESVFEFGTSVQIRTHPSSQGILSQTEMPFFPNPENKLVLVSFHTGFFGSFVVAALASDLLKIARENICEGNTSVMAWDDWGTTHTRVIQPTDGGRPQISVYGTRALVQDMDGRLSLYDFNQKLIRRDLAKQTTDPTEKVVIDPTVVRNRVMFMNEVKTCLPYRAVHIAGPGKPDSFRNCELSIDGLIFMPLAAAENLDVDIYSF